MMQRYILLLLMALTAATSYAQADRDFIRRGNRFMRDSLYEKAQVEYQKALEADNTSTIARYNLGNALVFQSKPEDAMKEYESAAKMEKDPERLAHIYHNMGTLLQSSKKLQEAIVCYKQALRNNPHADDTRYNYLLCLRQLKEGGQDNQNQDQDENGQDEKKEQDQQQQEKKDQQNDQKEEQKEQDTPKPDPQQMSKENAEQMLKAAMQNEKDTQDKIQKAQQQPQRKHLQKQW